MQMQNLLQHDSIKGLGKDEQSHSTGIPRSPDKNEGHKSTKHEVQATTCDYELLDELVKRINASEEFDPSDESMPRLPQNSSVEELNLFQKQRLFDKADNLLQTTVKSFFKEERETDDPSIRRFLNSDTLESDDESDDIVIKAQVIIDENKETTEMDDTAAKLFQRADLLLQDQVNPLCEDRHSKIISTTDNIVSTQFEMEDNVTTDKDFFETATNASSRTTSSVRTSGNSTKKHSTKDENRIGRDIKKFELHGFSNKHSKNFFRRLRRKREEPKSTKVWESFNWQIPQKSKMKKGATGTIEEKVTNSLKEATEKDNKDSVNPKIEVDLDDKFLEGLSVLERKIYNETECELCDVAETSAPTEEIVLSIRPKPISKISENTITVVFSSEQQSPLKLSNKVEETTVKSHSKTTIIARPIGTINKTECELCDVEKTSTKSSTSSEQIVINFRPKPILEFSENIISVSFSSEQESPLNFSKIVEETTVKSETKLTLSERTAIAGPIKPVTESTIKSNKTTEKFPYEEKSFKEYSTRVSVSKQVNVTTPDQFESDREKLIESQTTKQNISEKITTSISGSSDKTKTNSIKEHEKNFSTYAQVNIEFSTASPSEAVTIKSLRAREKLRQRTKKPSRIKTKTFTKTTPLEKSFNAERSSILSSQLKSTESPLYTRIVIENKEYDDDENVVTIKEENIIQTVGKKEKQEKKFTVNEFENSETDNTDILQNIYIFKSNMETTQVLEIDTQAKEKVTILKNDLLEQEEEKTLTKKLTQETEKITKPKQEQNITTDKGEFLESIQEKNILSSSVHTILQTEITVSRPKSEMLNVLASSDQNSTQSIEEFLKSVESSTPVFISAQVDVALPKMEEQIEAQQLETTEMISLETVLNKTYFENLSTQQDTFKKNENITMINKSFKMEHNETSLENFSTHIFISTPFNTRKSLEMELETQKSKVIEQSSLAMSTEYRASTAAKTIIPIQTTNVLQIKSETEKSEVEKLTLIKPTKSEKYLSEIYKTSEKLKIISPLSKTSLLQSKLVTQNLGEKDLTPVETISERYFSAGEFKGSETSEEIKIFTPIQILSSESTNVAITERFDKTKTKYKKKPVGGSSTHVFISTLVAVTAPKPNEGIDSENQNSELLEPITIPESKKHFSAGDFTGSQTSKEMEIITPNKTMSLNKIESEKQESKVIQLRPIQTTESKKSSMESITSSKITSSPEIEVERKKPESTSEEMEMITPKDSNEKTKQSKEKSLEEYSTRAFISTVVEVTIPEPEEDEIESEIQKLAKTTGLLHIKSETEMTEVITPSSVKTTGSERYSDTESNTTSLPQIKSEIQINKYRGKSTEKSATSAESTPKRYFPLEEFKESKTSEEIKMITSINILSSESIKTDTTGRLDETKIQNQEKPVEESLTYVLISKPVAVTVPEPEKGFKPETQKSELIESKKITESKKYSSTELFTEPKTFKEMEMIIPIKPMNLSEIETDTQELGLTQSTSIKTESEKKVSLKEIITLSKTTTSLQFESEPQKAELTSNETEMITLKNVDGKKEKNKEKSLEESTTHAFISTIVDVTIPEPEEQKESEKQELANITSLLYIESETPKLERIEATSIKTRESNRYFSADISTASLPQIKSGTQTIEYKAKSGEESSSSADKFTVSHTSEEMEIFTPINILSSKAEKVDITGISNVRKMQFKEKTVEDNFISKSVAVTALQSEKEIELETQKELLEPMEITESKKYFSAKVFAGSETTFLSQIESETQEVEQPNSINTTESKIYLASSTEMEIISPSKISSLQTELEIQKLKVLKPNFITTTESNKYFAAEVLTGSKISEEQETITSIKTSSLPQFKPSLIITTENYTGTASETFKGMDIVTSINTKSSEFEKLNITGILHERKKQYKENSLKGSPTHFFSSTVSVDKTVHKQEVENDFSFKVSFGYKSTTEFEIASPNKTTSLFQSETQMSEITKPTSMKRTEHEKYFSEEMELLTLSTTSSSPIEFETQSFEIIKPTLIKTAESENDSRYKTLDLKILTLNKTTSSLQIQSETHKLEVPTLLKRTGHQKHFSAEQTTEPKTLKEMEMLTPISTTLQNESKKSEVIEPTFIEKTEYKNYFSASTKSETSKEIEFLPPISNTSQNELEIQKSGIKETTESERYISKEMLTESRISKEIAMITRARTTSLIQVEGKNQFLKPVEATQTENYYSAEIHTRSSEETSEGIIITSIGENFKKRLKQYKQKSFDESSTLSVDGTVPEENESDTQKSTTTEYNRNLTKQLSAEQEIFEKTTTSKFESETKESKSKLFNTTTEDKKDFYKEILSKKPSFKQLLSTSRVSTTSSEPKTLGPKFDQNTTEFGNEFSDEGNEQKNNYTTVLAKKATKNIKTSTNIEVATSTINEFSLPEVQLITLKKELTPNRNLTTHVNVSAESKVTVSEPAKYREATKTKITDSTVPVTNKTKPLLRPISKSENKEAESIFSSMSTQQTLVTPKDMETESTRLQLTERNVIETGVIGEEKQHLTTQYHLKNFEFTKLTQRNGVMISEQLEYFSGVDHKHKYSTHQVKEQTYHPLEEPSETEFIDFRKKAKASTPCDFCTGLLKHKVDHAQQETTLTNPKVEMSRTIQELRTKTKKAKVHATEANISKKPFSTKRDKITKNVHKMKEPDSKTEQGNTVLSEREEVIESMSYERENNTEIKEPGKFLSEKPQTETQMHSTYFFTKEEHIESHKQEIHDNKTTIKELVKVSERTVEEETEQALFTKDTKTIEKESESKIEELEEIKQEVSNEHEEQTSEILEVESETRATIVEEPEQELFTKEAITFAKETESKLDKPEHMKQVVSMTINVTERDIISSTETSILKPESFSFKVSTIRFQAAESKSLFKIKPTTKEFTSRIEQPSFKYSSFTEKENTLGTSLTTKEKSKALSTSKEERILFKLSTEIYQENFTSLPEENNKTISYLKDDQKFLCDWCGNHTTSKGLSTENIKYFTSLPVEDNGTETVQYNKVSYLKDDQKFLCDWCSNQTISQEPSIEKIAKEEDTYSSKTPLYHTRADDYKENGITESVKEKTKVGKVTDFMEKENEIKINREYKIKTSKLYLENILSEQTETDKLTKTTEIIKEKIIKNEQQTAISLEKEDSEETPENKHSDQRTRTTISIKQESLAPEIKEVPIEKEKENYSIQKFPEFEIKTSERYLENITSKQIETEELTNTTEQIKETVMKNEQQTTDFLEKEESEETIERKHSDQRTKTTISIKQESIASEMKENPTEKEKQNYSTQKVPEFKIKTSERYLENIASKQIQMEELTKTTDQIKETVVKKEQQTIIFLEKEESEETIEKKHSDQRTKTTISIKQDSFASEMKENPTEKEIQNYSIQKVPEFEIKTSERYLENITSEQPETEELIKTTEQIKETVMKKEQQTTIFLENEESEKTIEKKHSDQRTKTTNSIKQESFESEIKENPSEKETENYPLQKVTEFEIKTSGRYLENITSKQTETEELTKTTEQIKETIMKKEQQPTIFLEKEESEETIEKKHSDERTKTTISIKQDIFASKIKENPTEKETQNYSIQKVPEFEIKTSERYLENITSEQTETEQLTKTTEQIKETEMKKGHQTTIFLEKEESEERIEKKHSDQRTKTTISIEQESIASEMKENPTEKETQNYPVQKVPEFEIKTSERYLENITSKQAETEEFTKTTEQLKETIMKKEQQITIFSEKERNEETIENKHSDQHTKSTISIKQESFASEIKEVATEKEKQNYPIQKVPEFEIKTSERYLENITSEQIEAEELTKTTEQIKETEMKKGHQTTIFLEKEESEETIEKKHSDQRTKTTISIEQESFASEMKENPTEKETQNYPVQKVPEFEIKTSERYLENITSKQAETEEFTKTTEQLKETIMKKEQQITIFSEKERNEETIENKHSDQHTKSTISIKQESFASEIKEVATEKEKQNYPIQKVPEFEIKTSERYLENISSEQIEAEELTKTTEQIKETIMRIEKQTTIFLEKKESDETIKKNHSDQRTKTTISIKQESFASEMKKVPTEKEKQNFPIQKVPEFEIKTSEVYLKNITSEQIETEELTKMPNQIKETIMEKEQQTTIFLEEKESEETIKKNQSDQRTKTTISIKQESFASEMKTEKEKQNYPIQKVPKDLMDITEISEQNQNITRNSTTTKPHKFRVVTHFPPVKHIHVNKDLFTLTETFSFNLPTKKTKPTEKIHGNIKIVDVTLHVDEKTTIETEEKTVDTEFTTSFEEKQEFTKYGPSLKQFEFTNITQSNRAMVSKHQELENINRVDHTEKYATHYVKEESYPEHQLKNISGIDSEHKYSTHLKQQSHHPLEEPSETEFIDFTKKAKASPPCDFCTGNLKQRIDHTQKETMFPTENEEMGFTKTKIGAQMTQTDKKSKTHPKQQSYHPLEEPSETEFIDFTKKAKGSPPCKFCTGNLKQRIDHSQKETILPTEREEMGFTETKVGAQMTQTDKRTKNKKAKTQHTAEAIISTEREETENVYQMKDISKISKERKTKIEQSTKALSEKEEVIESLSFEPESNTEIKEPGEIISTGPQAEKEKHTTYFSKKVEHIGSQKHENLAQKTTVKEIVIESTIEEETEEAFFTKETEAFKKETESKIEDLEKINQEISTQHEKQQSEMLRAKTETTLREVEGSLKLHTEFATIKTFLKTEFEITKETLEEKNERSTGKTELAMEEMEDNKQSDFTHQGIQEETEEEITAIVAKTDGTTKSKIEVDTEKSVEMEDGNTDENTSTGSIIIQHKTTNKEIVKYSEISTLEIQGEELFTKESKTSSIKTELDEKQAKQEEEGSSQAVDKFLQTEFEMSGVMGSTKFDRKQQETEKNELDQYTEESERSTEKKELEVEVQEEETQHKSNKSKTSEEEPEATPADAEGISEVEIETVTRELSLQTESEIAKSIREGQTTNIEEKLKSSELTTPEETIQEIVTEENKNSPKDTELEVEKQEQQAEGITKSQTEFATLETSLQTEFEISEVKYSTKFESKQQETEKNEQEQFTKVSKTSEEKTELESEVQAGNQQHASSKSETSEKETKTTLAEAEGSSEVEIETVTAELSWETKSEIAESITEGQTTTIKEKVKNSELNTPEEKRQELSTEESKASLNKDTELEKEKKQQQETESSTKSQTEFATLKTSLQTEFEISEVKYSTKFETKQQETEKNEQEQFTKVSKTSEEKTELESEVQAGNQQHASSKSETSEKETKTTLAEAEGSSEVEIETVTAELSWETKSEIAESITEGQTTTIKEKVKNSELNTPEEKRQELSTEESKASLNKDTELEKEKKQQQETESSTKSQTEFATVETLLEVKTTELITLEEKEQEHLTEKGETSTEKIDVEVGKEEEIKHEVYTEHDKNQSEILEAGKAAETESTSRETNASTKLQAEFATVEKFLKTEFEITEVKRSTKFQTDEQEAEINTLEQKEPEYFSNKSEIFTEKTTLEKEEQEERKQESFTKHEEKTSEEKTETTPSESESNSDMQTELVIPLETASKKTNGKSSIKAEGQETTIKEILTPSELTLEEKEQETSTEESETFTKETESEVQELEETKHEVSTKHEKQHNEMLEAKTAESMEEETEITLRETELITELPTELHTVKTSLETEVQIEAKVNTKFVTEEQETLAITPEETEQEHSIEESEASTNKSEEVGSTNQEVEEKDATTLDEEAADEEPPSYEKEIKDGEDTYIEDSEKDEEQDEEISTEEGKRSVATTKAIFTTTENEIVRDQQILTEISVFKEEFEMAKITEKINAQNASENTENFKLVNKFYEKSKVLTTIFAHGGMGRVRYNISTEQEEKVTEEDRRKSTPKSLVIIVNNSQKKLEKINNTLLERLINKSVTDVDLEYIELHNISDTTTQNNRSDLFIGMPVEKCEEKDFEENKNCLCNIQQYLDTISKKIKNREDIHSKTLYCYKFIRPKEGLLIQSKSKTVTRKKRSLLYLKNLENEHEVVEHDSLEGLFHDDYKLDISENNIFALPGTMLEIPCKGKADKFLASANDNIWIWHSFDTGKDEYLPERGNVLTLHHITTNSTGNYTCFKEEDKENPDKMHTHELEVITFPIYEIQMTIFYLINSSCELSDADILYSYLPKIVGPLLCSFDESVCSVIVERPRCVNREDDTFYNVSILAKLNPDTSFFNSLDNEKCNINCKLKVYNNLVTLVNRNAEAIEHIPVHSSLPTSTTSDFIPYFSTKIKSPVDTKLPKIYVSCPAGFGLESTHQVVCVVCPKHTFSGEDEAFCKTCPPGQYQPVSGSKLCIQCNSPVDDAMCLRMLYSDTKLFKIYVGMAFGILILLLIGFALWTTSVKDQSDTMRSGYFEGSLRHRAMRTRKPNSTDRDVESGVRKPLLGSSRRRETPPDLPPVDF